MHNLVNIISDPTHRSGNIWDFDITRKTLLYSKIKLRSQERTISDHKVINLMFMQMLPPSNLRLSVFAISEEYAPKILSI